MDFTPNSKTTKIIFVGLFGLLFFLTFYFFKIPFAYAQCSCPCTISYPACTAVSYCTGGCTEETCVFWSLSPCGTPIGCALNLTNPGILCFGGKQCTFTTVDTCPCLGGGACYKPSPNAWVVCEFCGVGPGPTPTPAPACRWVNWCEGPICVSHWVCGDFAGLGCSTDADCAPAPTPTPTPPPPTCRGCDRFCWRSSQCCTGYCYRWGCRNRNCRSETDCTCAPSPTPTPTPTPIPTPTPTPTPTPIPTGSISGYVWDDTNTPNCNFNSGPDTKMAGRTVTVSGTVLGDISDASGGYSIANVPFGSYQVCVNRPSPVTEWKKTCPLDNGTNCETLTVNGSETLNFGLRNIVPGWFQAINGDIHANGAISIAVPSGSAGGYKAYILAADPNTAGGVCTAQGDISPGQGGVSERGFRQANYGEVPWPEDLINEVDHSEGILKYESSAITINLSNLGDYQGKVVVVNGDITVAGEVADEPGNTTNRINAFLIAKGKIIVRDSDGNKLLNVKGGLYAKDGIEVQRDLNNNKFPAMVVEYDPFFLLQQIPILSRSSYTWREVTP